MPDVGAAPDVAASPDVEPLADARRDDVGRRRPVLTDAFVLAIVGVATAAIHAIAVVAGLRLDPGTFQSRNLALTWQLLPARVLRHGLVSGLLHLHSQPPMFNLTTGILLELPRATQVPAAEALLAACAVLVAVATAGLLLEFRVRPVLVLVVVGVFVVADPAQYLFADFYFYALPTAALATAAGWAAVRWVRTERPWPGIAYGATVALLILTNSSYQAYTIALATVPILWVLRRRWRQAIAVLAVPSIVVVSWYALDVSRYGIVTTSSWVGMNLARSTLYLDSRADINALIRQGVLSPTARIRPFSALDKYGSLGMHAPTGQPALDIRHNLGQPNFNNLGYVAVSKRYLSDDLRWIAHRPGHYVRNTTIGLRLWTLPADQYYAFAGSSGHQGLGGYTTVYDSIVLLQPSADPYSLIVVVYGREGPGLSNLSYTVVAQTLLAILVLPFVAWRRRRRDRAGAAGALWVWVVCASVFVTTTLVEAAENNRFRFEVGGLPLVAAVVAVAWLADPSGLGRGLLCGAGGERDGGAGQALAVDDEAPRVAAGRGERERPEVDGHGDVDG